MKNQPAVALTVMSLLFPMGDGYGDQACKTVDKAIQLETRVFLNPETGRPAPDGGHKLDLNGFPKETTPEYKAMAALNLGSFVVEQRLYKLSDGRMALGLAINYVASDILQHLNLNDYGTWISVNGNDLAHDELSNTECGNCHRSEVPSFSTEIASVPINTLFYGVIARGCQSLPSQLKLFAKALPVNGAVPRWDVRIAFYNRRTKAWDSNGIPGGNYHFVFDAKQLPSM